MTDLDALRAAIIAEMPWYDDAEPDYTDLDAVIAPLITELRDLREKNGWLIAGNGHGMDCSDHPEHSCWGDSGALVAKDKEIASLIARLRAAEAVCFAVKTMGEFYVASTDRALADAVADALDAWEATR
jgi:hypothetical protein